MVKLNSRLSATILTIWLAIASATGSNAETILDAIGGVQRDLHARVGFHMLDMHSGQTVSYSENDRFPLNSTFKVLACGALLSYEENGKASTADMVSLQALDIVDYSPAIQDAIKAGHLEISLGDACRMTLSVSDNTAANTVLSAIGGPTGLTKFLRTIGDDITRLDRWETELNEAKPGDLRDTTTPRAIAYSLQRLVLGDVLSSASRKKLRKWLSGHRIAGSLFRASLPTSWTIDDRTGAGGYGSRSIIAILFPPKRKPIVATLFITETIASFRERNAAAARIGKAIVESVENK